MFLTLLADEPLTGNPTRSVWSATATDIMKMPDKRPHCFAILALGKQYRFHARELLNDLEFFAPDVPVIVLTDRPLEFKQHPNARVSAFKPDGILRYYHDKRFLIERAMDGFETCMIIDANTRITSPVEVNPKFEIGISAYVTQSLKEHFGQELNDERSARFKRFMSVDKTVKLVYQAAEQLGVDPAEVGFIYEFMYAVTGESTILRPFLSYWDQLAHYMDYHGVAWSEGYAIGIAAAKVGLPIRKNPFISPNNFYKHRLHRVRIERQLETNPRIILCHRQQRLLQEYAHFTALSGPLPRHFQKLKMGLRWLTYRVTGRRYRNLPSSPVVQITEIS